MNIFPCVNENHLETIAGLLEEERSGSQLTEIFSALVVYERELIGKRE